VATASSPGNPQRYWFKILQERGTANLPSADADASQQFGRVPSPNLPHLNPAMECRGQSFQQFSKINPAICRVVDSGFAVILLDNHFDQLHFQLVLEDALLDR
jgi:hypothetical protein